MRRRRLGRAGRQKISSMLLKFMCKTGLRYQTRKLIHFSQGFEWVTFDSSLSTIRRTELSCWIAACNS
ncbi:unnamed protein product [Larinioides sclopetarius]